jgi:hypothetical protein
MDWTNWGTESITLEIEAHQLRRLESIIYQHNHSFMTNYEGSSEWDNNHGKQSHERLLISGSHFKVISGISRNIVIVTSTTSS